MVVEVQVAPDSVTVPLLQLAVAEPVKPLVWLVALVVVPWLKPLKLYVQLPEVSEPAAHGLVVEVQVAPDSVTVPLLQLAVAEPA